MYFLFTGGLSFMKETQDHLTENVPDFILVPAKKRVIKYTTLLVYEPAGSTLLTYQNT
jgi:hypothetical protein